MFCNLPESRAIMPFPLRLPMRGMGLKPDDEADICGRKIAVCTRAAALRRPAHYLNSGMRFAPAHEVRQIARPASSCSISKHKSPWMAKSLPRPAGSLCCGRVVWPGGNSSAYTSPTMFSLPIFIAHGNHGAALCRRQSRFPYQ